MDKAIIGSCINCLKFVTLETSREIHERLTCRNKSCEAHAYQINRMFERAFAIQPSTNLRTMVISLVGITAVVLMTVTFTVAYLKHWA